ncbi:hypothetical protein BCR34DRAFT_604149 [Clohesyomyces aquaticus]|uniref:Uncharacterized protein n=1 Tax=Clohesyomyces aquaticus TaxID=1231657 RepID=A0A1Y1Z8R9_9PLEO|nr:hypothetical protein BCR34DRAFT_604149 [Clohesyomyces aquaticus]
MYQEFNRTWTVTQYFLLNTLFIDTSLSVLATENIPTCTEIRYTFTMLDFAPLRKLPYGSTVSKLMT